MSRIHEALKTASAAPANRLPAPPPPPPPRAEGVFVQAPEVKRSATPMMLGIAAAILLLAGLGLGMLLGDSAATSGSDPSASAPAPVHAAAAPLDNAVVVAAEATDATQATGDKPQAANASPASAVVSTGASAVPVAAFQSLPSPVAAVETSSSSPVANPTIASATPTASALPVDTAAVAPVVATVSAEPERPAFRLQGITYHSRAAAALINGRMVGLGDEVSGARVTKIEREAVTLAVSGRTEVLRLR